MIAATFRAACCLAGTALFAGPALAAPLSEAQAERLVAAERPQMDVALDAARHPARALAFMQVEPGDRVIDLFAGSGYYTQLLAGAVGSDGFVISHNLKAYTSRADIEAEQDRRGYGAAGTANVAPYFADFDDVRLAPNSLDGALFHMVYHDLYVESAQYGMPHAEPQAILSELNRALRPGGTVTVIDHVGSEQPDEAALRDYALKIHRIAPSRVIQDFRQAGFELVEEDAFFENPADLPDLLVFDPAVRGQTNRFALRFAKVGDPNVVPAAASGGTVQTPASGAQAGVDDGDACGASQVQAYVGHDLTDAVRTRLQSQSGAERVRIYESGQPVTMDYRADRLNVELAADSGTIVELSCG